ncbi:hypothetical protein EON65_03650 [archaeon]|nr:MAG: hypothetical protein EON65_03650 [archaeon]
MQNLVVFVPLVGTSKAYGVLEIHGLHPEGRKLDVASYKRSSDQMRAMINAKDYSKFVSTARFWKKLAVAKYAGMDQSETYIIMSGRIKEVLTTRNGVPFYGGPRYNILWENGKVDKELNANELLTLFESTPQSLGVYTVLDEELSKKLLVIGFLLGSFLEGRKCDLFLQELRGKMAQQRVNVVGMIEMALQSISNALVGVRELYLIGYVQDSNEIKSLLHYVYIKRKSYVEKFEYTGYQVVAKMVEDPSNFNSIVGGQLYRLADNGSTDWVAKEIKMPSSFRWGKSAQYDKFILVLHKSYPVIGMQGFSKFDENVICGVVHEIQSTITVLWEHDQRRKSLREFIKVAEGKLLEWRDLEINEICYNLVNCIPEELLVADLYVGLLQPQGRQINYVATTRGSRMEGNVLRRDEGISFDVIDNNNTIILQENDFDKKALLVVGATVEVYYGKKLYKGVIKKIWGHDQYDIEYKFDRKTEAGVEISRIIPISKAFRAKQFSNRAKLPFIVSSVRHGSKVIGVLGCDRINAASLENGAVYHDLQVFLEQLGRLLGSTIDVKIKKSNLQSLYRISRNQVEMSDTLQSSNFASNQGQNEAGCRQADIRDLVTILTDLVFNCSVYTESVMIAKYSTTISYGDYYTYVQNQLPPSIMDTKGTVPKHLEKKIMKLDFSKYGSRALQRVGKDCLLILTHMKTTGKGEDNSRYGTNPGLLLVLGISYASEITDVDYEFFESLQKGINSVLYSIISQKASSEIRFEALNSIQKLCNAPLLPDRQTFFYSLTELVHSCYPSTNMYVGVLGAFNSELHYIMASQQSNMLDKRLSRYDIKGVSFLAVDGDKGLCILATHKLASSLKHFGERQRFEYPFLVTPLVCHIDSIVGILAADNCAGQQIVTDTEDSLSDVMSFFNTVSIYLNKPVVHYRVEDILRQMSEVTDSSNSYVEGITKLLRLLFNFLPFAKRIHQLTFQPYVLNNLASNHEADAYVSTKSRYMSVKNECLIESYTVILTISRVQHLSSQLNQPVIKIFWQGMCIHSMPCTISDHIHMEPLVVKFPAQMAYQDAKIVIKLFSLLVPQKSHGKKNQVLHEREVGHKTLDMRYFIHTPLTTQDHIIFSTDFSNMNALQIGILSKFVCTDSVVGFLFHTAELKYVSSLGLQGAEQDLVSKYKEVHLTFYWQSLAIGRTRFGATTTQHKWEHLDLFVAVSPSSKISSASASEFVVELSSVDAKNQNLLLGSLRLTMQEVEEYLNGDGGWLEISLSTEFSRVDRSLINSNIRNSISSKHGTDFICFFIQLFGENVTGNNVLKHMGHSSTTNEGQVHHGILYDLLQIPRPMKLSKAFAKESTLLESRKIVSFQNRTDGIKCEIGVLAARDLFALGDPFDDNGVDRSMNCLVKVYFNNEMVGSTSIVYDNFAPTWTGERFHVLIFPDEDMEQSVVSLELYRIVNENGLERELLMGTVDIKGFELTTLLMGPVDHEAWFDVGDLDYPERSQMITTRKKPRNNRLKNHNRLLTTQLKVCGKLVSVIASSMDKTAVAKHAKEPGYLELTFNSLRGIAESIRKIQVGRDNLLSASYSVSAFFNERLLWRTAPVDLIYDAERLSDDYSTDQLAIGDEKVLFRFPLNQTLFQSKLRIEVSYAQPLGTGGRSATWLPFAAAELTGSKLVGFIGQPGTVTRSFHLKIASHVLPLESTDSPRTSAAFAKDRLGLLASSNQSSFVTQNSEPTSAEYPYPLAVQLKGGPEDAAEVFQYDELVVSLDILAAIELPQRGGKVGNQGTTIIAGGTKRQSNEDFRPEVYCIVIWNHKLMGKTVVHRKSTHAIFHKQRLLLPVPIFPSSQPRLHQCSLQIDVYDQITSGRNEHISHADRLIGAIYLDGFAIDRLCNQSSTHIGWFDISAASGGNQAPALGLLRDESHGDSIRSLKDDGSTKYGDSSAILSAANSFLDSSTVAMCGSLKVQLQLAQVDTNVIMTNENADPIDFILHVVECKDLLNTDPYGGANAMVDIYWNGKFVGSTQVIRNTTHPIYSDEYFVLRSDTIDYNGLEGLSNAYSGECVLELQVWSLAINKSRDFLGKIVLANSNFFDIIKPRDPLQAAATNKMWEYFLRPNEEFTHDENSLVNGSVTIELSTLYYRSNIRDSRMTIEAVLWLYSALNLPTLAVWTYEPAFLARIFRSYEREGGEKIEIYRSSVVKSVNPLFRNEFCVLRIPADEDWTGFGLEIEITFRDVVMASLTLSTDAAKALLTRSHEAVMEVLTFPMTANPELGASSLQESEVKVKTPSLMLAGGLRESFDENRSTIEETGARLQAALDRQAEIAKDNATSSEIVDVEVSLPLYFTAQTEQIIELRSPYYTSIHDQDSMTLRVNWNEEQHFVGAFEYINSSNSSDKAIAIKKAVGQRLSECRISISVFLSGHIAGSVEISSKTLLAMLEAKRQGLNIDVDIPGDTIKVHLWARLRPQPGNSRLFATSLPKPVNTSEVFLSVLAATDLSKVNMLGGTDSFVTINYCGVSLGESPVVKDKLDPVWPQPKYYQVRFPAEIDLYDAFYNTHKKEEKDSAVSITRDSSMDDYSSIKLQVESTKVRSDHWQPVDDFWMVDDLYLSVELYHYNKNGKHVLLGCIELQGKELINIIAIKEPYKQTWFALGASNSKPQSEQKAVSAISKISVLCSRYPNMSDHQSISFVETDSFVEGTEVNLHVLSVRSLCVEQAEVYVRFRYLGNVIGKTYAEKSSGTSVHWENEKSTVYLPTLLLNKVIDSHSIDKFAVFDLEVWQSRQKREDILLGVAHLTYGRVKYMLESNAGKAIWQTLEIGGYYPSKVYSKDITGELEIRLVPAGLAAETALVEESAQYRIVIHRVVNVAPTVNVSNMTCFVIVKWNDWEIGKTRITTMNTGLNWQDQEFTLTFNKASTNIAESRLVLEIWSQKMFSKADCIGAVVLHGKKLEDILAVDQRQEQQEDANNYAMKISDILASGSVKSVKHYLRGELEFSVEHVTNESNSRGSGGARKNEGLKDIAIRWQDLVDTHAGTSLIELKLQSATVTFISSSLFAQKSALRRSLFSTKSGNYRSCTLFCRVLWCGNKIYESKQVTLGDTDLGEQLAKWSSNEENLDHALYIHNRLDVSSHNKVLRFELRLAGNHSNSTADESLLSYLNLPFHVILRLYCGAFTFPLSKVSELSHVPVIHAGKSGISWQRRLWKSSISFEIKFLFSYWDSVLSSAPNTYKRKIIVLAGGNLPVVNNDFPNTKCTICIDDVIVAKSSVVLMNTAPNYPRLFADIMIDLTKRVEIKLQVIHIHSKTRKEVVLGQCAIPFEYLLKPPQEDFDVYLGPSNERRGGDANNPKSEFRFSLSGFLKVHIIGRNQLEPDQLSFSNQHHDHAMYTLSSQELSLIDHSIDLASSMANGADVPQLRNVPTLPAACYLTEETRNWLGTCLSYAKAQTCFNQSKYLLLPLYDIGIVVGKKKSKLVGITPGYKTVLAVERDEMRLAISDATLAQDILTALSSHIVKLRWKDVNRELRENSVKYFKSVVNSFMYENVQINDFSKLHALEDQLYDVLITLILYYIPGATIRRVTRSSDNLLLIFEELQQHYIDQLQILQRLSSNVSRWSLPVCYGNESSLFGRCLAFSQHLVSYKDLEKQVVCGMRSLVTAALPFVSMMVHAEDRALYVIQIENVKNVQHHHCASMKEMYTWLELLGEMVGEMIYGNREKFVLSRIEEFFKCWSYSLDDIMECLFCYIPMLVDSYEFMEILQFKKVHKVYEIDSTCAITPASQQLAENGANQVMVVRPDITRKLTLSSVRVSKRTEKKADMQSQISENQKAYSNSGSVVSSISSKVSDTSKKLLQGFRDIFSTKKSDNRKEDMIVEEDDDEDDEGLGNEEQLDHDIIDKRLSALDYNGTKVGEVSAKLPSKPVATSYVLGVWHDGIEQVHGLSTDVSNGTSFTSTVDIHIHVPDTSKPSNAKEAKKFQVPPFLVVLYEIDVDNDVIVCEYQGYLNFSSIATSSECTSTTGKLILFPIVHSPVPIVSAGDVESVDDKDKKNSPFNSADNVYVFDMMYTITVQLPLVRSESDVGMKSTTNTALLASEAMSNKIQVYSQSCHHVALMASPCLSIYFDHVENVPLAEVLGSQHKSKRSAATSVIQTYCTLSYALSSSRESATTATTAGWGRFGSTKKSSSTAADTYKRLQSTKIVSTTTSKAKAGDEKGGEDQIQYEDMMNISLSSIVSNTLPNPANIKVNKFEAIENYPNLKCSFYYVPSNQDSKSGSHALLSECIITPHQYLVENQLLLPLQVKLPGTSKGVGDKVCLHLQLHVYDHATTSGNSLSHLPPIYQSVGKFNPSFVFPVYSLSFVAVRLSNVALNATATFAAHNASSKNISTKGGNYLSMVNMNKFKNKFIYIEVVTASSKSLLFRSPSVQYSTKEVAVTCADSEHIYMDVIDDVYLQCYVYDNVPLGANAEEEDVMLHNRSLVGQCLVSYEEFIAHHLYASPTDNATLTLQQPSTGDSVGSIAINYRASHCNEDLIARHLHDRQVNQQTQFISHLPKHILTNYNKRPLSLQMIYDPKLEYQRRLQEHLDFKESLQSNEDTYLKYMNYQVAHHISNHESRLPYISELHYAQLVNAFKRAERTIVHTNKLDKICLPLSKSTIGDAEHPPFPYYLNIAYRQQEVSKKELSSLTTLTSLVHKGVNVFLRRDYRKEKFGKLLRKLHDTNASTLSTQEMLLQTLLECELTYETSIDCYMYNEHSSSYQYVSVSDNDNSRVIRDHNADFVSCAVKLLRHNVGLLCYNNVVSVINLHSHNQNVSAAEMFDHLLVYQLPELKRFEEVFDDLEGAGYVRCLLGHIKSLYPQGVLILPLFSCGALYGTMVYRHAMTWPSCIYEYTNILEKASLVKLVSIEQDLFTSSLKVSAQCIQLYLKSRVNSVLKSIKSFPVHVYSDIAIIVRYVFRQILSLFPFVSDISLWMVNSTKHVTNSHQIYNSLVPKLDFTTLTSESAPEANINNSNGSATLFTKLFGASTRKPKGLPPTAPKSSANVSRVASIHESDSILASKLTCGSFGAPAQILSAPNERNAYSGAASGATVETRWVSAPLEVDQAMPMNHSSRTVLELLYAELLTHIKRKIDTKDPGKGDAAKKKVELSQYRVLSGHTLYALASSKSSRLGDTVMPLHDEGSSMSAAYNPKNVHSVLCELFQVAKMSTPRVESVAGIATAPSGILHNLSRNISFGLGNAESALSSPSLSRAGSNADVHQTSRQARNSVAHLLSSQSVLSRDSSRTMSFLASPPPPPPPGTNPANLHFFLSLKTNGLGGDMGFGLLSSEAEVVLKDIVAAFEAALNKYHTVIYGNQLTAVPPDNMLPSAATLHPPSLSIPAVNSSAFSPAVSSNSTPVSSPIVTSRAEKRSVTSKGGNDVHLLKASLSRPKSRVGTPDQT